MNKLPSNYKPKGNYPWQNPTWQDLRELAESREENDDSSFSSSSGSIDRITYCPGNDSTGSHS